MINAANVNPFLNSVLFKKIRCCQPELVEGDKLFRDFAFTKNAQIFC
jgi:hypothetical protein